MLANLNFRGRLSRENMTVWYFVSKNRFVHT